MSNIFLDLGTHYGQGLRDFISEFDMNEEWIIHSFEANPITYDIFLKEYHHLTPWVVAKNMAVSDHFGKINLNIETPEGEGDVGMGSSTISLEKWNPWNGRIKQNFKKTVEVDCFDLSDYISKLCNSKDRIIIKMDIEGSEYDVLERLIETNVVSMIEHLSVEWHSHFFTNEQEMKKREQIIMNEINSNGIDLRTWR